MELLTNRTCYGIFFESTIGKFDQTPQAEDVETWQGPGVLEVSPTLRASQKVCHLDPVENKEVQMVGYLWSHVLSGVGNWGGGGGVE